MGKKMHQELSYELYERTIDFIQEELYYLLEDNDLANDLDDKTIELMNKVVENYFNNQIVKKWEKQ